MKGGGGGEERKDEAGGSWCQSSVYMKAYLYSANDLHVSVFIHCRYIPSKHNKKRKPLKTCLSPIANARRSIFNHIKNESF